MKNGMVALEDQNTRDSQVTRSLGHARRVPGDH